MKEIHKRMIELYESGLSGREVALQLGIKHSNSVRQVLKRHNKLRTQSEAASLAIKAGKRGTPEAFIVAAKTTNRFNPKKSHPGPSHPNWIKDRTKLKRKRLFTEEREFFKQVFKERNFTCELTGEKGKLSLHHIKGVWQHPELIFERKNCIVVLKIIHAKFHKIYGNRAIEEDWFEFVRNKEYGDLVPIVRKRNYYPFEDLTGKEFGRLSVLKKIPGKWLCQCSCGNKSETYTSNLKSGKTQSCGCLMREKNRQRFKSQQLWKLSPSHLNIKK